MKNTAANVFALTLLLLCSAFASAADTQTLSVTSGLSSNYVHTVFRDSQHILWFGTENGLDRYDGQTLSPFTRRLPLPLKGAVRTIAEISPGEMLIGTTWGAFIYQIRKNLMWPVDFGRASIDVRCIRKMPDGTILLATEKGLFTLNREQLKTDIVLCCDGVQPALNDILQISPSLIRLAGDDGVYEFKSTSKGHLLRKIFKSAPVRCLHLLQTTLYIGTTEGLLMNKGTEWHPTTVKGTSSIPILSLASDSAGTLYIGTDNSGLLQIPENATSPAPVLKEIPALKSVESLFCDESNTLWCGTFNGGVVACFLRNTPKFRTYEYPNSGNANFRSLIPTPEGGFQIGTRDGVILTLNKKNEPIRSIGDKSGKTFGSRILTTLHRSSIKPDHLLVGTFGGGLTLLKSTSETSRMPRIPEKSTVYQCYTEPSGRLWIATLDGLFRQDTNGKTQRIDLAPCTGSNELFCLCPDQRGGLWIGTKTGACLLHLNTGSLTQPAACKPYGYQCTSILTDSKGCTWFCFNKGGVLKLSPDLHQQMWLTHEIGMPENAPSSLVEDRYNNIWIGSSKTLYKVNSRHDVHAYGPEDGLKGAGFCPQSAVLDASGSLWWLNEKGLVTYLDENKSRNPFPPVIHLSDLIIHGIRYDADTMPIVEKVDSNGYRVTLTGRENHKVSLRLAALNYRFSNKNQYSFLLEGVEKDWSRASGNPVYECPDLSPGTYTLLVKACNNDEIWTSTPTRIELVLKPYFRESWWFILSISLLLILLLWSLGRWFLHHSRAKWALEYQEKKRSKTITTTRAIDAEKAQRIQQKLNDCMQNQQLYLNSELKINDLASAIGIHAHELSQVLNLQMNQSFADYVNAWRVEAFKHQIVQVENQRFTHTAIAMQCGFNAKSSFLRAFRKATGTTPTEYLKTLESVVSGQKSDV